MGSAESARATGGPRRFCRMPVPKSNTLILDGPGHVDISTNMTFLSLSIL